MRWWYENEAEEMKLYKNEDLCIECKNEFYSKPYDHRDPTPGQLGYCIKCDNCLIKEKKMEFLRERVFTSLNADELKAGDKVIVAYNLYGLKEQVKMFTESAIDVIEVIQDEDYFNRFKVKHSESYPLAYLVERAENCTNCEYSNLHNNLLYCDDDKIPIIIGGEKLSVCSKYKPKTEQKAENCIDCSHSCKSINPCLRYEPKSEMPELISLGNGQYAERKHYRPFRDTDELIKVWGEKSIEKSGGEWYDYGLTMPLIWVKEKEGMGEHLIGGYTDDVVFVGKNYEDMDELFEAFTFLDGTPCGVEE